MKLPLLVSAAARNITETAKVRLHEGNWKIVQEGLVDSRLELLYDDLSSVIPHTALLDGVPVIIVGPCVAQVVFSQKGTEKSLSVYAELQPS